MTIHLPAELERFVHDQVRAGRYAREDDVIRDALARLRRDLPGKSAQAKRGVKRARSAAPKKTMTEEDFDRHLLTIGLISSLPDPALDIDDDDPDDQPVTIKGEPLSETIIRERR